MIRSVQYSPNRDRSYFTPILNSQILSSENVLWKTVIKLISREQFWIGKSSCDHYYIIDNFHLVKIYVLTRFIMWLLMFNFLRSGSPKNIAKTIVTLPSNWTLGVTGEKNLQLYSKWYTFLLPSEVKQVSSISIYIFVFFLIFFWDQILILI